MSGNERDQAMRGGAEERTEAAVVRLPASTLTAFAADILAACGMAEAQARAAAELVVEADLIGAGTHGVIRLPMYVEWLRGGHLNPAAKIRLVTRSGGTALIDGDNGFGHLVVAEAARTAIAIARETGVAWVGTRGSNHAGAGGIYAAMPVAQDMIGIYAAVSGANHMAVWGGAEPRLGTNPIAIGVPAGEEPPVILDIATSLSSMGAVKKHALEGRPIPDTWLASRADGSPITDPARAAEGFLLPIGGHKGSGLALMIGLLAGVLNGAAFGRDLRHFADSASRAANTGQLVIALDVSCFLPVDAFKSEIDRHVRDLRTSPRLPGVEAIRLPGDERARRRRRHLAEGVALEPKLIANLDALAGSLGVAPLGGR